MAWTHQDAAHRLNQTSQEWHLGWLSFHHPDHCLIPWPAYWFCLLTAVFRASYVGSWCGWWYVLQRICGDLWADMQCLICIYTMYIHRLGMPQGAWGSGCGWQVSGYLLVSPRISEIRIRIRIPWWVSSGLRGYPPADSGYPQRVQSGHL